MVEYAADRHEWKAAQGTRGKCAAGEVFGCIPHGCARAAGVGLPERSEPEGPQGAARERIVKVTPLPCGLSTMVLLYQ